MPTDAVEHPALAESTVTARTLFVYLGCFWAALLIPDLGLRYKLNELGAGWADGRAVAQVSLHAKLAHQREHAGDYDLLFVGDSRTFTNLAPDLLDPELRTRSFNLGRMANWFPTQYPSYRDLAPRVPAGATVVWSIGHQNFRPIHAEINDAYPVGFGNAIDYLRWGYAPGAIGANVAGSVPGLRSFSARERLYGKIEAALGRPGPRFFLGSVGPITAQPDTTRPHDPPARDSAAITSRLAEERTRLKADPRVYSIQPLQTEEGRVASLEVLMHAGNYLRIELEPEYFRARQRAHAETLRPLAEPRFEASPEYWRTFVAIVDVFEKHGVRLIVNEFEEAPYQYDDPHNRELYRGFMREVRDYVEGRGIPFVRVDFSRLGNQHYFDYNHFNREGVRAFSSLFVPELSAALQRIR